MIKKMENSDKKKTKELDKIILNNESYDKLIDLIKNPPEPSPKLVKLFKEFNKTKELDWEKDTK